MKKTLATTALGAVLTLTSLGSAFAAEVPAQSIGNGQLTTAVTVTAASNLDEATQSKVKAIFDQMQKGTLTKEQAKSQLKELGVDVDFDFNAAHDGIKFKGKVTSVSFDEATNEKAKAILDQAQAGTLTKEQAKSQLQELGIDLDVDFSKTTHRVTVKMDESKFGNLDDAAKEKAKAILEQAQAGSLTKEQVKAQLQELGIDMDVNFSKAAHGVMVKMDESKFGNLDDAAKEKAKAILEQVRTGELSKEQARSQLQELGIELNMDFSPAHNMKKETKAIHFDDATQQKVKALFDQSKAGTITKEQMKKQLDEVLGVQTLDIHVEK
ncbi:hypothetical protein [Paenibacillus sp. NAIST15-1]|uniref:hypothetical protein n=1 Tax=Paenibacillus sp. NAIST15-1 TaxID=1605994 RepID=UPI00086EE618|nr:hypothetical protein [Paenibacillus sp. NAIST15-1]GAV10539.1 hypothetical protein PBN151_0449 [Paenibacillus sp. NAIST15-1]